MSERPEWDLPIFGAMGKASSVALGVAMARPDRRGGVLDGDGGLLMNLGSLVTVAGWSCKIRLGPQLLGTAPASPVLGC